jgi:hypothetical protein
MLFAAYFVLNWLRFGWAWYLTKIPVDSQIPILSFFFFSKCVTFEPIILKGCG